MDRNAGYFNVVCVDLMSLSARRAWIEIVLIDAAPTDLHVALRKESVDRNKSSNSVGYPASVALRKESVDRNASLAYHTRSSPGRSPQGERG